MARGGGGAREGGGSEMEATAVSKLCLAFSSSPTTSEAQTFSRTLQRMMKLDA